MGIFSKAGESTGSGGGNWIKDGAYSFMVEKLHVRKGHAGVCFIAEMRVLEAAPVVVEDGQGNAINVVPNRVGSSVSFVQNMTKYDSAHDNIKSFFIGLLGGLGWKAEQIGEQQMDSATVDANPMRGARIKCATYRKLTKGTKTLLVLPKWTSVEQTAETIKQGVAFLATNAAKADPTAAQPQTYQPVAGTSAMAQLAQTVEQAPAPAPQPTQPAPQTIPTPVLAEPVGGAIGLLLGPKS